MFFKIHFWFLLNAVNFCESLPPKDWRKIVGGNQISIEDAPYQVALMEYYEETEVVAHYCGGSLISDEFVLTAGHCILNPPSLDIEVDELKIRVGSTSYYKGGELHDVHEIMIHPNWGSKNNEFYMDYDYALVELAKPLRFSELARPINLPEIDEDPPEGLFVFISGWGETLDENADRDILRAIEIPIVDRKLCNKRWKAVIGHESGNVQNVITERMICAAADVPEIDACNGDSGGPLVRKHDEVLLGIVSWGDNGCINNDLPGIYSRVSVVRDWIKDVAGV